MIFVKHYYVYKVIKILNFCEGMINETGACTKVEFNLKNNKS
jgi:hypothetical protein